MAPETAAVVGSFSTVVPFPTVVLLDLSIRFKRLDPAAVVPEYKTEQSAGLDLSPIEGGVILPGEVKLFKTGLAVALPNYTVGRILPRSSRLREGCYIDGVIDADYRGELGLQIRNVSGHAIMVVAGERYAQLIVQPVYHGEVRVVEELDQTERGEGGFGSTGK